MTSLRFLIDECLSLELVTMAHNRGFAADHVAHLGLASSQDHELMPIIIKRNYTLVTSNSMDFRGNAVKPGAKGHYSPYDIHAGLICINPGPRGTRKIHVDGFDVALNEIQKNGLDMVSTLLEVTWDQESKTFSTRMSHPFP